MSVVSGEYFCTRTEDIFNFGCHGRVKFEIKSGFIYMQENTTSDTQYPCFDTAKISKYKW